MVKEKLPQGAMITLFLLFLVSTFSYLDRFVLSVLLPSIKEDLSLTDTQLGAITTAFTWSYVLMAIPFARMADRHSRKAVISVSLTVWSAMTAVCGLAQNFVQLALARVLVGVGEAGATPPAHSLISDYFPLRVRAKALAVYGIGAPIGLMVGFMLASWLAETYSWRIAFLTLGIPGIVLALAFFLVVKEPKRGQSDMTDEKSAQNVPSFSEAITVLIASPAYRHLCIATGLYTIVYIGVVSWIPSYFIRSFDMSLTQVGFWLAMSLGLSQLIGMASCGVLTDIMIQKSKKWYCWIPALAMFISTPLFIIVFGTSNVVISTLALFPAFMIGVFQGPASFAAIQGLAPIRARAMAVAVFLLTVNIIGGTIGPLFTGGLSDYFVTEYGKDSLKWSLMLVSVVFGLWAGVHYAMAGRTIAREMEAEA